MLKVSTSQALDPDSIFKIPEVLIGLTAEFPNLGIPTELAKFCSVTPRKKWLIPVYSDSYGIADSELRNRTERNGFPTELCHLSEINIKLVKKILSKSSFPALFASC